MSGLYLSGMDLPREGYRQVFIMADGEVIYFPSTPQNGELRFKAIPVPDHGRLIDVDALIEKCEEMADDGDGNQLDALVLLRWFFEQKAPPIIPADGGNENVDS